MNIPRTSGSICSETDPRPLYELVDKDGGKRGPFDSIQAACWYARDVWPDQEQDEERSGKGWDVQVAGS